MAIDRKWNQTDAAKLIGRTSRALRDSDAPRNDDGSYDPIALVQWFTHQTPDEKRDLEIEVKREQHREKKRENDKADGLLLDRRQLAQNASRMQSKLRELGDAFARKNRITGPQAQAMLNETLAKLKADLGTFEATDK